MESTGQRAKCLALLLAGFVEPPQAVTSLRFFAESQTRLPCHYQEDEGEKVVQFGRYSGRVRFESGSPTVNSALLIPSTEESDEGSYACRISTFPNGNFERHITLTVWILPISSLEPMLLVEGQPFGVVASCRAVGRPPPLLSWDTDLPGRSQNRSKEGGAVSSYFSLHPLRSMNGKKLDCLVWHPGLEQPRRISHRLLVQYPPEATISSGTADWFVGLEKAELVCGKTSKRKGEFPMDNMLLIIIGASAGALVLILVLVVLLVNRYHRHRNKKLEMELSEKTEEIQSFSRQASFRRLNSVSTDPRVQPEDYALLRVDSRMKNSQLSLSTLGGKWGSAGGVEVDELGRPVLWHDGRDTLRGAEMDGEKEEQRRRVESYLKNSNMSLDSGLPSSLVPLKAQQDEGGLGPREPDLGHVGEGDSPRGEDWPPPPTQAVAEGHDEDNESSSYQLSEALTHHFYYSKGVLRPRPHSNAILLHPRGQII
ncbi:hypothetical protein FQN60_016641 [Etheostoma spectabile]|uniref:Ig-like domain-containing protein n=1 Tax=Etheostoma spectabile TaxID=54343 RepID=A0A5J5D2N9_9PERO|nr:hypothetical protein FQN60_016641 [Etheostoma spectabile]